MICNMDKVFLRPITIFKQNIWHEKRKKDLELYISKPLNCSNNSILFPKLFWPTVRRNCSSDRETLMKFEAKFLRSQEQFIRTLKCQNNFLQQNAFLTYSWKFLSSNTSEQLKLKLNKLLGFRNLQEKLKKQFFPPMCFER